MEGVLGLDAAAEEATVMDSLPVVGTWRNTASDVAPRDRSKVRSRCWTELGSTKVSPGTDLDERIGCFDGGDESGSALVRICCYQTTGFVCAEGRCFDAAIECYEERRAQGAKEATYALLVRRLC